jgi:dihydrodipicolinate synthase/N-acetylneuraminate lyase
MNTSGAVPWRGYWPAAPTPFAADGSLDEDSWRALLGLYADHGVHGVLVNGTTGEWFSQTPESAAGWPRSRSPNSPDSYRW